MLIPKLNKLKIFGLGSLTFLSIVSIIFLSRASQATEVHCKNVFFNVGEYDQKASCDVIVREAAAYGVYLEYFYPLEGKENRESFRKTLGIPAFEGEVESAKWSEQKYPLALRLEIKSAGSEAFYYMHTKIAPEVDIKGPKSVMAELTRVYLAPGKFNINITVSRTSPELKGVSAQLKFSHISGN